MIHTGGFYGKVIVRAGVFRKFGKAVVVAAGVHVKKFTQVVWLHTPKVVSETSMPQHGLCVFIVCGFCGEENILKK